MTLPDATPIRYHVPSLPEDTTTATLCGLLFGTPPDGFIHRDADACAHPVTCPDCLQILIHHNQRTNHYPSRTI